MRPRSPTPNKFWGEQGKRVDWIKPYTKVKNTSYDPHNVSIKWFEDGTLNLAYNCIDRHLAKRGDQTAIIWEGDDPKDRQEGHLQAAARRGLQIRQCPEGAGRQEGRPRHHLSADDRGSGLRDARLRAHRRGAFGGVRRLLAGFDRRPHRGLHIDRDRHRRRGPARRPQDSAEGQYRRGLRQGRRRHLGDRGQAHRRAGQHEGRPRRLLRRGRRRALPPIVPARR